MHDFAVSGSGVSGGRVAYELAGGGASCVMLEAGRAYDRTSFPPDELGYTTQMYWNSGLEVTKDGTIGMMRGKCLGGTSVLNQADFSRFDTYALDDDWRPRTGIEFLTVEGLTPAYEYLDDDVASGEIAAEHRNPSARMFTGALEQLGYHWQPINRGQTDCRLDAGSDCIVCLGGCPRDAKQSALVAQLPQARAKGLEVETEWEVLTIEDRGDHGVVVRGSQRGRTAEVRARQVVLAAGAFGNVAILQRSELAEELPALGTGFACHPQIMTFGLHEEPVDAHKGALQSVESHDTKLREEGLKLENVFGPPIAMAMLLDGWGVDHLQKMKRYRHLACFEVAIRDENTGTVEVGRNGQMKVDKALTDVDRAKIARALELSAQLHDAAGASEVELCDTTFGLHLMGGCAIGTDPARSVVGPDFRVHGHPNLWSADSSVFPSAPGQNPSYTIMALSYLAAGEMLNGG